MSAYQYIAYPFDVIKTNRIINSNFNKECGENLGRELVTLYERGSFRNGGYRGMMPLFGITAINNVFGGFHFDATGIKLVICTALSQPLNNMMTQRQVISGGAMSEPGYRGLMNNGANLPRLCTLGFTAALARNAFLMGAFLPKTLGNESLTTDIGFAFGAVLLSHPFEVARTLIVCNESSGMLGSTIGTLRTLFATEGVAGLYRGFIPRSITMFPLLLSLTTMAHSGANQDLLSGVRTNPLLMSLKLSSA